MKKCVLSLLLKEIKHSVLRIEGGRVFQSLGAATVKARSPVVLCFENGSTSVGTLLCRVTLPVSRTVNVGSQEHLRICIYVSR